jgi:catechol 2,3-dioxygenase-like lactoylglutathione lyase family enzyme
LESITVGLAVFRPHAYDTTNDAGNFTVFIVRNVDQTVAFYRDSLGFEARFQEPDRDPFFAIIGRDGGQIFIKSEKDVAPLPNSKRHPHLRLDAFIYVQDRMHSPPNFPSMVQHLAYRSRIPTTAFAASRFATLTATSCPSGDQATRRHRDYWRKIATTLGYAGVP